MTFDKMNKSITCNKFIYSFIRIDNYILETLEDFNLHQIL